MFTIEIDAHFHHLNPYCVEQIKIESRGENGYIHMVSGHIFDVGREKAEEVRDWLSKWFVDVPANELGASSD